MALKIGAKGDSLGQQQERTLLMAWIVSMFAPLGTGVAYVLGPATVLFADFLRRTSELVALFLAWVVHRHIQKKSVSQAKQSVVLWENMASIAVSLVMFFSFAVISYRVTQRIFQPDPVGWILPGIMVSVGGLVVNGWFWRRSRYLAKEESTPVMESHWRLYRAKTVIDISVIGTLSLSRLFAGREWSLYIDPAGTLLIAVFLFVSAYRIGHRALAAILKD